MRSPEKTRIIVSAANSCRRYWAKFSLVPFFAIVTIFLSASSVYANPIGYEPKSLLSALIWLFALEGIVLAFLIGIRKIKKLKFILLWTAITSVTWILFYLWSAFFSLYANSYLIVITGEILVVIVEAYLLRAIISSGKFTWEHMRISMPKSLVFSFLANAVSAAGGALLLYISMVNGTSPCLAFWEISALSEKAQHGDIAAANKLQWHYSMCDTNKVKADYWRYKAAEYGDAKALYFIYSERSRSGTIDTTTLNYLVKAAEHGSWEAQEDLADRYFSGEGMSKSAAEGEKWLRRAATAGIHDLMLNLSVLILTKNRDKQSFVEAYVWSKLLFGISHADTMPAVSASRQMSLIKWAAINEGILGQDWDAAVEKEEQTIMTDEKQRVTPAFRGIWVGSPPPKPKNDLTALHRAAEHGDRKAQATLYELYFSGEDVKQDIAEGEKWLRCLAYAHDPFAIGDLIPLILIKAGDRASMAEAYAWSKFIIANNNPEFYVARNARRYMAFIEEARKSHGISESAFQIDVNKFEQQISASQNITPK